MRRSADPDSAVPVEAGRGRGPAVEWDRPANPQADRLAAAVPAVSGLVD